MCRHSLSYSKSTIGFVFRSPATLNRNLENRNLFSSDHSTDAQEKWHDWSLPLQAKQLRRRQAAKFCEESGRNPDKFSSANEQVSRGCHTFFSAHKSIVHFGSNSSSTISIEASFHHLSTRRIDDPTMNDIPMHIIVNPDDNLDFIFIAAESYEEDTSISSLIDDVDDNISIPTIAKERDQMSVSTTEDEFEDDTTLACTSDGDSEMASFSEMDYGQLSSSENVPEAQDLSYNVTDVTCPMCFFSADGGEAIVVPHCNHSVCLSCFQDHIRTSHKVGLPVCCPLSATGTCSEPIGRSLVKQIESMEIIAEDSLEPMVASKPSNYHSCPTVGCTNLIYWKEGNGPPLGDCFQCNRTCCLKCGVSPYHTNKTCDEYQTVLDSQRRAALDPLHLHLIEERGESNTRRCSF